MKKLVENPTNNKDIVKVIVLVVMVMVSLASLFGIPAAGISVIVGLVAFFIVSKTEKQTVGDGGLERKWFTEAAKTRIWFWIAIPSIINILVIVIAGFILPDYITHVISRSEMMLSVDKLPILMIQLLFFAIVEEISWRGFFQKQIQTRIPVWPAILFSSAIFSLGHLTSGSLIIVIYDLLFVFINSLFYGYIFKKTNSVWMSAISHWAANLTAVVILFLL